MPALRFSMPSFQQMCRKTSKRITQTHTHTTAMTTIYLWGSAHQGITSNKVSSFVQKKWLSLPIWLVWHDVTHKHFISSLHVEHFGQSQKSHQNVTPCPKKFQHRVKSTAYIYMYCSSSSTLGVCFLCLEPIPSWSCFFPWTNHTWSMLPVWSPHQVNHAFFPWTVKEWNDPPTPIIEISKQSLFWVQIFSHVN